MAVHDILDALGLLLLLVLLVLLGFAVRRRLLQRRGGTFDCSLRNPRRRAPKGWMLGVGRYSSDTIEWYRVFSFSPRPRDVVGRRGLEVLARRAPSGAEALALLPGAVVLDCAEGERRVELAIGSDALTGFLAWLESAPPGQHSSFVA
ncbi:uncharacterized protein DUF2550 [Motilibacter rhizosphaerae]|uniref:Uncharacterized protein DUF2550 n=1 Tax=Motilibacter rhizosphaerae TaxID=598652 RepID=A0A4Q7NPV8_9ACTN|nr:DUF2550 domain-containing protein [Motilibacter rhizosphaerae]RZS87098.1 uncharacterized protein DUF2550 [Motilibacter rhizosphaerae]